MCVAVAAVCIICKYFYRFNVFQPYNDGLRGATAVSRSACLPGSIIEAGPGEPGGHVCCSRGSVHYYYRYMATVYMARVWLPLPFFSLLHYFSFSYCFLVYIIYCVFLGIV